MGEKNFLCVQRCTWCFILCKSKENFEIIKTIFLKLARTFKQLNDECEEYLLNVRIINRNKDNSNIPNDSKALFCKRFLLRDKLFKFEMFASSLIKIKYCFSLSHKVYAHIV